MPCSRSTRTTRSPVRLSIAATATVRPQSIRCTRLKKFSHSVPGRLFLTLLLVLAYVGIGILFYGLVENWSFIDAAYFSMVTMSTVGYGDLTPTTPWSKAWTVGYCRDPAFADSRSGDPTPFRRYTLAGIIIVFTQLSTLMTRAVERPISWIR